MRLLTHNFLQSNVKGTEKGYPLIIDKDAELLIEESPVDRNMVLKMLPKLDYDALVKAANQIREQQQQQDPTGDNVLPQLPESAPILDEGNDATIAMLHKILFDVHVIHGHLVCPDTGRRFPIKDGIPNMILHEDEI